MRVVVGRRRLCSEACRNQRRQYRDFRERHGESQCLVDTNATENANTGRERDVTESQWDASLTSITGVGETRAAALHRVDIDSVGDVLDSDVHDLSKARGIGEVHAGKLKEAAEEFVKNGHSVLDPGQPVIELGSVEAKKANALNAAGYETVREVVDADLEDLAEVKSMDATSAEYIQGQAKKADKSGVGGQP